MWIILLILSLASETDFRASLETLDGRRFVGNLISLNGEGVALETAQGRQNLPLGDLLELAPQGRDAKTSATGLADAGAHLKDAIRIELNDGSTALGRSFAVRNETAVFHPLSVGGSPSAVEIPLRRIVAVRLRAAEEETLAQWNRILKRFLEEDAGGDLLVVEKDDSLDYHRGVLGDIGEKAVDFKLDGEVLPVPRGKVFGVVYHRTSGDDMPAAICRVSCKDGSCWAAHSIELRNGSFFLETPSGAAVSLPRSDVARLDFSTGKILYLDEIEPESSRWTPYFGGSADTSGLRALFGPQSGRGEAWEPIRLGGKEFSRGILLHSRAELVYRLPENFKRFRAAAGIDDRVRPGGNVRLVISGGERVLLDKVLRGSDPPLDVDVDLGGAGTLRILVDYGDDLDTADHLGLGDARVVK